VYGLLKGIRNHRIDSPHVTGKSGGNERPNACNLCHTDRSLGWAADALARWYKQPLPPGLAADDTPASVEWLIAGDAVLRAIAAWQFGWDDAQKTAPTAWAIPYLAAAMADPYSAVRYVAGRSLGRIDAGNQFDYVASPDARRREAAEILRRWQAAGGGGDLVSVEKSVSRLLEHRDDTRVRALE